MTIEAYVFEAIRTQGGKGKPSGAPHGIRTRGVREARGRARDGVRSAISGARQLASTAKLKRLRGSSACRRGGGSVAVGCGIASGWPS
jgi:hypothetical protein